MQVTRLEYPPVIVVMDVMRITGIWPDHMGLAAFENTLMNGVTFELTNGEQLIGFFLLHSAVPGIQIQEDLMILPAARGRWATRGNIQQIRSAATRTAFEEMGLERIVGYVDEDNRASRRLTEHMGMKCEGRLRHFNRVKGAWRNMMAYSLLRDEA